jgi:hypothetical protein
MSAAPRGDGEHRHIIDLAPQDCKDDDWTDDEAEGEADPGAHFFE